MINLQILANDDDLDILLVNESWLRDFMPDNSILKKYNIYRKDRSTRGGGVMIAIKDIYKSILIENDNTFEDLFVEVYIRQFKLLLITLYRPPKQNIDFDKYFIDRFAKIDITYFDTILLIGDLNIPYNLNDNSGNPRLINLKNSMLTYGLQQIVHKPTYPAINPKSILDLVFTNNLSMINNVIVQNNIAKSCDHLSINIELNVLQEKRCVQPKYKRNYTLNNLVTLNEQMQACDWHLLVHNIHDIDIIFERMKQKYTEILDKYIPLIKVRENKPKRFNPYINSLIKSRRQLVRSQVMSDSIRTKYFYLTERIGEEIVKYESNKMQQIMNKSHNFNHIYKYIKGQTKNPTVKTFLDSEGKRLSDPNIIVKKFKEIFEAKFKDNPFNGDLSVVKSRVSPLSEIEFCMNDLLMAYKKFKFNSAQGNSFIDNIVLQKCLNGSTKLLFCLFSKIIILKDIPNELKISMVTPIPKPGRNPNLLSNYRGVAVQTNVYRLFENVLSIKLIPYLNAYNIIHSCQYGFRTNISLYNLHLDVQKIIFSTFNRDDYLAIDLIFLDLSDAFDSVCHKKLLRKLELYGVTGDFLDILANTFNNRRQVIKWSNPSICSDEILIKSGCLQGGVLSPTLFNIYISDLPKYIDSKIFIYADDILIVRPIFNKEDCEQLQLDLGKAKKFCDDNFLRLNTEKTKHLRITYKKNEQYHYALDNTIIESIQSHKHIGIIYDCKMLFNNHIKLILANASRRYFTIRFLVKRRDGPTLLRLYLTYILPILEFGNLCLVLTKTQAQVLEKVQRSATKDICQKFRKNDLTYEQRLKFLNIESLENRRTIQMLKLIFKIIHSFSEIPSHLFEQIAILEDEKNGRTLLCPSPRLMISNKYLLFKCVEIFNELPMKIRNETNFANYKLLIKNHYN